VPAGGPDYDPNITNHPESPFALINATLQQTLLNYAKLRPSRGVDFEVGYQHNASDGSHIKTRLLYTMMLQRDDFLDPANPDLPDPGLYELGDPKDSFNLNVDYEKGPFTLGYQLRYIGKMLLNANEDIYSVKGAPPQNAGLRQHPLVPERVLPGCSPRLRLQRRHQCLSRLRQHHGRNSADVSDRHG
jgi:hypothetical protein